METGALEADSVFLCMTLAGATPKLTSEVLSMTTMVVILSPPSIGASFVVRQPCFARRAPQSPITIVSRCQMFYRCREREIGPSVIAGIECVFNTHWGMSISAGRRGRRERSTPPPCKGRHPNRGGRTCIPEQKVDTLCKGEHLTRHR